MFFVPLADQEKAAVAVLPVSTRPFVDQKEVAVVVLRGPSWKKEAAVAVAVLRGPPCPLWTKGVAVAVLRGPSRPFVEKRSCRCSCRSPWPSVSSADKRCCRCRSSRSFAALRGKKKLPLQLPFSVALRGPPCPLWTKGVAVAVLRGPSWPFVEKRSCRCSYRSPPPSADKTK